MPWRHMGERRYSSYSYVTSTVDGGEWSASRPGRALPPEKKNPVPIGQEAGWAPEPVWTQRLEEKSSAPVGDRTPIFHPVVRHYTACATAAPQLISADIFRTHSAKIRVTTVFPPMLRSHKCSVTFKFFEENSVIISYAHLIIFILT
jgi:hypothetical protein